MSPLANVLAMASLIGIWLVALTSWAFVARYTLRTWWRTEEGQHLMAFTVVFAMAWMVTGLVPFLNVPLEVALGVQLVIVILAEAVIVWRHALLSHSEEPSDSPTPDDGD